MGMADHEFVINVLRHKADDRNWRVQGFTTSISRTLPFFSVLHIDQVDYFSYTNTSYTT